MFKGVSVSSASGKIKFLLIKNANEMYSEINKLLIERQKKEAPSNISSDKTDTSNDLIKLKKLLDMNVITQEEFDSKKKQILGL
ncbi:MAG: SHOCT domain-containing protein [Clostridia bacterium]|nr:SHOCT domain-containing protein [Clostridia bacterium]